MSILLRNRKRFEVDEHKEGMTLLRKMLSAAPWRARWDYNGGTKDNFFGTQVDWNQTLVTRINEISAHIHTSTLTGGADTIVICPELLPIFDDLDYYNSDTNMLGNRIKIHVNNYMPSNEIIISRATVDPEDLFKNNRLMGVIKIDNYDNSRVDVKVVEPKQLDKKYLLIG